MLLSALLSTLSLFSPLGLFDATQSLRLILFAPVFSFFLRATSFGLLVDATLFGLLGYFTLRFFKLSGLFGFFCFAGIVEFFSFSQEFGILDTLLLRELGSSLGSFKLDASFVFAACLFFGLLLDPCKFRRVVVDWCQVSNLRGP